MENGELNRVKIGDRRYSVVDHEKWWSTSGDMQPKTPKARIIEWSVEEYIVVWVGKYHVFCEKKGECGECELLLTPEFLLLGTSKEQAENKARHNNTEWVKMLKKTTCYRCKNENIGGNACVTCERGKIIRDNYVDIDLQD